MGGLSHFFLIIYSRGKRVSGLRTIFQTLFNREKAVKKLEKNHIEEIFSELEDIHIRKRRMNHYAQGLNIKEEACKQYTHLDKETHSKINQLAQQAREIEEKKKNLKARLISNNAALNRLSAYEESLPDLIKEIQIAEKRRRETESHILYLQEERSFLEEERGTLLRGYGFLKALSIFLIIFIGAGLLISFIMLQVLREKVWFVLSGIVLVTAIGMLVIVLTKEKLEKEISSNGILQKKAVKYLNKAKIRFFNQTQYLEFQYQKLGVESAAKLELYYNRYLKNKNNERIYLKMNKAIADIEEEILQILQSNDVRWEGTADVIEWALEPKSANEIEYLEKDKEKTKQEIEALEEYEDELWKELALLSKAEEHKKQIEVCLENYVGENRLDKILALSIK